MAGCRRRKLQHKRQRYLRRRDLITRMLVDLGLHYLGVLGTAQAREFMHQQKIPEHVIVRVLKLSA
ncbi:hypothetical protein ACO0LB_13910 [Undibacterium sp. SXout7W]|uniref:hypothetical protein n=1 Tax=Undibacterium sp. SXout7W TaxID=3413049 RepID=UPI003BF03602